MATAEMYKGRAIVAYVDGKAVDSNGEEIEGAPKQPKDTDPSQQPHAMAALNTEERSAAVLANAFATALGKGAPKGSATSATTGQTSDPGEGDMPTIKELPDHVAKLTTVKEVKAMAKRDERVSAEPIYAARIAELEAK
jgi:hypothetical protein